MNLRSALVWPLAVLPGITLLPSAAGQSPPPAAGLTILNSPAPPGARTVCLGQRRDGVRAVSCFDVYRIENGPVADPVQGIDLQQYMWKYTAEAHGGGEGRLVRLAAGVNSDSGSTYDWAPEQSLELQEPADLAATVATDLDADPMPGGAPRLNNPTDGWRFRGLAGWLDPLLSDHRFAVTWTAPKGRPAPRGAAAQVAGATIWGSPVPGPPLLPATLRLEVTYR